MKLWGIWKDRCHWTQKPNFTPGRANQIKWGNWTDKFLDEYRSAECKLNISYQPLIGKYTALVVNKSYHEYTILVDAAFNDDTLSYATGYAIFYPGGSLCVVGFRKIPPTGSVMAAEVKAIYNGVLFGEHNLQGPKRILSDSLEAIHAIRGKEMYKGVEEINIRITKRLIEGFSITGVWYCKRAVNTLAHKLAKDALVSPILAIG